MFNVPGGGCAAIFGPDGRCLTEYMSEEEDRLIFAELDLDSILAVRAFVDACGHYSRPDMLWLGVDSREKGHARCDETYQQEQTENE
jgi:hypothetical protein